MKYLTLPVIVEAVQFTDTAENILKIIELADEGISIDYRDRDNPILKGLESGIEVLLGDYLVKEVDGEVYHWSKEHFELKHKQL
jgi:hypothetical protein